MVWLRKCLETAYHCLYESGKVPDTEAARWKNAYHLWKHSYLPALEKLLGMVCFPDCRETVLTNHAGSDGNLEANESVISEQSSECESDDRLDENEANEVSPMDEKKKKKKRKLDEAIGHPSNNKLRLGKDLKHVIDEVLDEELGDSADNKNLTEKILNALRKKVLEASPDMATIFDDEGPDDNFDAEKYGRGLNLEDEDDDDEDVSDDEDHGEDRADNGNETEDLEE
jgi:hypothetical protein